MHLMHGRTSRLIYSALVFSVLTFSSCGKTNDGFEVLPDESGTEIVDPGSGSSGEVGDGSGSSGSGNAGGGTVKPGPTATPRPAPTATPRPQPTPSSGDDAVLQKYDHLDPQNLVDTKLLREAVLYFDANQSRFANKSYITVIDFSKRSSVRRMYIIDVKTGAVWALPTAHGKGSDPEHDGYAEKFSNVSGSNASSLGYYKVAETYYGKHGLSIRMDGLSTTNSAARARAVVIHGASYVQDRAVIQGRSFGCPAVPNEYRDRVVSMLKGGSLLYAGLSGKR